MPAVMAVVLSNVPLPPDNGEDNKRQAAGHPLGFQMATIDDLPPRPIHRHLNNNVLFFGIFPTLERTRDLISLASTCKALRTLVYSADNIWSSAPMAVCMHSGCCGCGREQVGCALIRQAVTKTAVAHLVMHLKCNDLLPFFSKCKENKRRVLRRLQLLLEPPIGDDLLDENTSSFFDIGAISLDISADDEGEADAADSAAAGGRGRLQKVAPTLLLSSSSSSNREDAAPTNLDIEDLVVSIASTSEWHGHLADTSYADLFCHIGANLRVVKFRFASPANLFATLPSLRLEHIEVDGPQEMGQLLALNIPALIHLRLKNSRMRLSGSLQCPKLQTFEFYGRLAHDGTLLWRNATDVHAAIAALPPSLIYIELSMDPQFINVILRCIADRFPLLESLILEMPDEVELEQSTKVSQQTILILINQCPNLYSIEFRNSFVTYDVDAFLYLAQFRKLRKLRLIYDEDTVDLLPALLENSPSIEEVHLYQDRGEIFDDEGDDLRWGAMDSKVEILQEQFSGVFIHLDDEPGDDNEDT